MNEFIENFYDINWKLLIESADSEIEIVVYYFDSWLKQYRDSLKLFLEKPNTRLRIILSDPVRNMNTIRRIYPDHKEKSLNQKIIQTKTEALSIIDAAKVNPFHLEVYLYPHPLSYAIQSFDRNKVVLSVFEFFREDCVQSPAFLLNLTELKQVKRFIDKEIDGLIIGSNQFD